MGRSTWEATSRTRSSVKRPPTAVTPSRMVGLYFFATSSSDNPPSSSRAKTRCSGFKESRRSVPKRLCVVDCHFSVVKFELLEYSGGKTIAGELVKINKKYNQTK